MPANYTLIPGASEGIGREFAKTLASEKHNLILTARNVQRLEELKRELMALHDKKVDCVINNAGFQVPIGPFEQSTPDQIRAMMAVNMTAVTELSHHFLPGLISQRGILVNVASHAAFQPVPYMAAYAATKAFVLHFTEALQSELQDKYGKAVFVLALCPGATRTKFWERSASPVEKTKFIIMSPEAAVKKAIKAMRKRTQHVLIPSLLLGVATQTLRVSTRKLNLFIAKKLVGY